MTAELEIQDDMLKQPIGSDEVLLAGDVKFSIRVFKSATQRMLNSQITVDNMETLRIAERLVRASDDCAEALLLWCRNDVSVAIDRLRDVFVLWRLLTE